MDIPVVWSSHNLASFYVWDTYSVPDPLTTTGRAERAGQREGGRTENQHTGVANRPPPPYLQRLLEHFV